MSQELAFHGGKGPSTASSLELQREIVQRWLDAGVQGGAIHATLKREHGLTGSYSAVRRM